MDTYHKGSSISTSITGDWNWMRPSWIRFTKSLTWMEMVKYHTTISKVQWVKKFTHRRAFTSGKTKPTPRARRNANSSSAGTPPLVMVTIAQSTAKCITIKSSCSIVVCIRSVTKTSGRSSQRRSKKMLVQRTISNWWNWINLRVLLKKLLVSIYQARRGTYCSIPAVGFIEGKSLSI